MAQGGGGGEGVGVGGVLGLGLNRNLRAMGPFSMLLYSAVHLEIKKILAF